MVIDLNRCVRCRTCYVACKRAHGIVAHPKDNEHPYEYYRLRYVEWEWGKYPETKRASIPIHCMQCNDPHCIISCPTEAIKRRSDGATIVDNELCNGCGVCLEACPYGALYIGPDGKADCCDFCAKLNSSGLMPECVEMCPAKARYFGDADDPESEVSILINMGKAKPLLLDGITSTRVYYIPSANEPDWAEVSSDEGFLGSLNKRKRDFPPVKGLNSSR